MVNRYHFSISVCPQRLKPTSDTPLIFTLFKSFVDFPGGSVVKNLPAMKEMQETQVWSLYWEDPVEGDMATHSNIFAWRIPWTEEPDGLQTMGFQRDMTKATEPEVIVKY